MDNKYINWRLFSGRNNKVNALIEELQGVKKKGCEE